MKIIKTANGRTKMRFSKEDWLRIGYDAKWLKVAGVDDGPTNQDRKQATQEDLDRSIQASQEDFDKRIKESTDLLISLPSEWAKNLGTEIQRINDSKDLRYAKRDILNHLEGITRSELAQDPWRNRIYEEIKKLKELCNRF